jgi:hypothetical protein
MSKKRPLEEITEDKEEEKVSANNTSKKKGKKDKLDSGSKKLIEDFMGFYN